MIECILTSERVALGGLVSSDCAITFEELASSGLCVLREVLTTSSLYFVEVPWIFVLASFKVELPARLARLFHSEFGNELDSRDWVEVSLCFLALRLEILASRSDGTVCMHVFLREAKNNFGQSCHTSPYILVVPENIKFEKNSISIPGIAAEAVRPYKVG